MKAYTQMSKAELLSLHDILLKQYQDMKNQGLTLNMARGKPDFHQITLSLDMLETVNSQETPSQYPNYFNYGELEGIEEAREFFAEMLETDKDHVIVFGNSSLNIEFDQISRGYTHGYMGHTPWCKLDKIKFLCPTPGYDRHFAITERFGIEMINIPMNEYGPDMDLVEQYVNHDESVKGIWCNPQYSNPTGITYSDEVVQRFAHLKPAAPDFRIFWDNAYIAHHLYEDRQDHIANILKACEDADNADIVFEFCSTSKMTFPGAGVAAMGTSINNRKDILHHMSFQGIGFDKLNQLRHVLFLKNRDYLKDHMRQQAEFLRPKFQVVLDTFDQELHGLDIGTWTNPLGGYFITFKTLDGCAKNIIAKCKEAGAILTEAGAAFPYGQDPHDNIIRIAPSFPSLEELKKASQLLSICIQLVSIEKLLKI